MASNSRQKGQPIVIVGAGVFGLTTALELKRRGYESITVVDRFLPPVIDGSSVDISRIIRVEYADALYAKMAREAYEGWVTEYSDYYYESGFVMLADKKGHGYLRDSQKTAQALGHKVIAHDDAEEVRRTYPTIQANLEGLSANDNPRGGWADAESSVRHLAKQCTLAGVSFVCGSRGTVQSLKLDNGRVVGLNVSEGPPILAAQVILATGAWTNRLIEVSHATTASGQPVGFIQLTEQEAQRLKGMPVVINLDTGVFCFPPFPKSNVLKVARHGYGYATEFTSGHGQTLVSSPKRDGDNASSSYLPADADAALRDGLRQLMPDFAHRPWFRRRLCWYSDTQKGDFVIDHHPKIAGLFVATGGAGQ